jgi:RNA polymerase sigma factor (TIGR02999 family)
MTSDGHEITQLLDDLRAGNREALDALVPLVYDELRRLAAGYLRDERRADTLQPTALVHDVYLRLVDQHAITWQNRAQFFAVAARVMRHALVDEARARLSHKRGGGAVPVALSEAALAGLALAAPAPDETLEALDEALRRLEALDPQKSRIVELRYFGGLSVEETADVLGVSAPTVKRGWAFARAWLHREVAGEGAA